MKYPLTNQFITKNLFSNSPLLLLTLSEMNNYFTVETFINGMNSLGKTKTISFLKRLSKDIEILLSEITDKHKHKRLRCSQSMPELKSNSTQIKPTQYPTLRYIQVQMEEMAQTKADISKVENLLKQNNFDYLDYDNNSSFLSKSTSHIKSNIFYSKRQNWLNQPIRSMRRNVIGSQSSKDISYKNIITIKTPKYKHLTQRNALIKGENSFLFYKYNKRNSVDMSVMCRSSYSKRRRNDNEIEKQNQSKNVLETTYEKLKHAVFVKDSDVNGKKTVEKLLSDWFGGKIYNRKVNVSNASRDVINMLTILKNKVEVTNIKKLMNRIYNNKIPVVLNHKLEYTEELDHKLKTLDLNFVKTLIKEKLKTKE